VVDCPTEAELGEPGLAERDQSGGEVHPREVPVAPRGSADERVGAVLGRHSCDLDVVLEEGGHAREEPGPRVGGLVPRPVVGLVRERAELRIDRPGPRDRCVDDRGDGQALPIGRREPDSVEILQRVVGEGVHASHGGEHSEHLHGTFTTSPPVRPLSSLASGS
jgi:hypothetical protein